MEQTQTDKKKLYIIVSAVFVTIGIILAFALTSMGTNKEVLAQINLGNNFLNELKYEDAILAFEKAIEIDDKYVPAYIGLADAYIGLEDNAKAIEVLEQGYQKTKDKDIKEKLDRLIKERDELEKLNEEVEQKAKETCENDLAMQEKTKEIDINNNLDEHNDLGPDYEIQWVDSEFEARIRQLLNKPTGTIMRSELDGITNLFIGGDGYISSSAWSECSVASNIIIVDRKNYNRGNIKSVEDVKHFKRLIDLEIRFNQISDISVLSNMTQIKKLDLYYNKIRDISPLENLTHLYELNLSNNQISDISPLENIIQLENLYLYYNQISDISPLENLTHLYILNLSNNQITDWSPVEHIENVCGRPE